MTPVFLPLSQKNINHIPQVDRYTKNPYENVGENEPRNIYIYTHQVYNIPK